MELPEQRHDLCADEAALRLGVRAVAARLDPLGAAVGLGLLPPERQQRADDPVLALRLDPAGNAARDETVEDGLDLVGGGVASRPEAVAGDRIAQLAERVLCRPVRRRRLDHLCAEELVAPAGVLL